VNSGCKKSPLRGKNAGKKHRTANMSKGLHRPRLVKTTPESYENSTQFLHKGKKGIRRISFLLRFTHSVIVAINGRNSSSGNSIRYHMESPRKSHQGHHL